MNKDCGRESDRGKEIERKRARLSFVPFPPFRPWAGLRRDKLKCYVQMRAL